MLSAMDNIRVMCMMAFVNILVRLRYTVDSKSAAPVTNKRRYTVCLKDDI